MSALGRHILAELHGVASEWLNDPGLLERTLVGAAQDAGATVIESSFNPFAPHGVTGIVVIQESHLSIHTWPEHGYAALDVFTCGSELDPTGIAQAVSESLKADRCDTQSIERGSGSVPPSGVASRPQGAMKRSVWFTNRQDNIALSLRHAGVLFAEQSAYQKVEVVESYGYGKILLLDNQVAFTERDEFVYHEMISHIPALHHPNPRRILIIGGGDGGACREFLKHEAIENITVVEIDPTVTEAAREHFPNMAASLDDSRVTLLHGDGRVFLDSSSDVFDIVVVDSLDTAGETPFDDRFFRLIKAQVTSDGLCVTQICAPTLSQDLFSSSITSQRTTFPSVVPYLAFLPTYSTGMLSFALAGVGTQHQARDIVVGDLRYLNSDVLNAAFALPTFVQNLIED